MGKFFNSSSSSSNLDSSAILTFASSLSNLPEAEVAKTKLLFIENSIDDYHTEKQKTWLIFIGVSLYFIVPVILFPSLNRLFYVFYPVFFMTFFPLFLIGFRYIQIKKKNHKRKILRVIEAWKPELGDNYANIIKKIK